MEENFLNNIGDYKIYNRIDIQDIENIFKDVCEIENSYEKKLDFKFLKYVDKGNFGYVYKYKNYAIKVYRHPEDNEDNEIFPTLQGIESYPKLYLTHHKFIVMEFIEGINPNKYTELKSNTIISFINDLITVLSKGILPDDLTDKNMIITPDNKIKIVDVGCYDIDDFNKINYMDTFIKESEIFRISITKVLFNNFLEFTNIQWEE